MRTVRVALARELAIGETDRRLFGAFVEHLGRCIYGAIVEPVQPEADARGFRRDALALGVTVDGGTLRAPAAASWNVIRLDARG